MSTREGVPLEMIRFGGYLSAPQVAPAEQIARRFLANHASLFRLSAAQRNAFVASAKHAWRNGVTALTLEQTDEGRSVFRSGLKFGIDRLGRVLTVGGPYYPGAKATGEPAISAADAVRIAADAVGASARRLTVLSTAPGPSRRTVFENTVATGLYRPNPITVELVTFPMPGSLPARIAWRTYIEVNPVAAYETVVDAITGEVLFRENGYRSSGPEGNVYRVQHPDIGGAAQQITSFAGASFDNDGWVDDRNTNGNNVNAYQDKDGNNASDFQPQTPASGDPNYQHFDYTFTNAFETSGGTDITTDQAAVVTQLFYYANVYHDYLYGLGFDEDSANFQVDNFGRGGSGGDPVLAEADDSWMTEGCNANFNTPADGSSPRMQMFVGKPSCGNPANQWMHRAMNGDTVFHESTHGLSERLIGNGTIGTGAQTSAMGEGWGDYMAISYWNDGVYGDYNNNDTTKGVRRYGYDTSPLKYSDLCDGGTCEEHDDGEIWAKVLWEMHGRLVAKYGYSADRPTSPPGSPSGNYRSNRLVVHGMDLTPTSASFLTARDKILAADTADYGGANQCLIWGAFASREMGFSATSAADQTTITTATDGPASCTPVAAAGSDKTANEGATVNFDGSGSTENGDGPFTYQWDFNNDSTFDATGKTASNEYGDNGSYTVVLKVTNANGFSDTDTLTVTVNNVNPTVGSITATPATADENSIIRFTGTITDPGWLDDLSATIDFDDGAGAVPLLGSVEKIKPNASLTYDVTHAYGDNGIFTVKVCGSDDDGGSGCNTVDVTIDNVDPTATIDTSGLTIINGIPTYIANAGQTINFSGRVTDPGSDDENVTWDWDDGAPSPDVTTLYLVNPPNPDPAKSPSVQPRDITDATSHAFGDACLYDITFASTDDDAGSGSQTAKVIIVGNATGNRSAGYWYQQYRRNAAFTDAQLNCYLEIVAYMSTVFNEVKNASTIALAKAILNPPTTKTTVVQQLDRQLLAAWLNFANGSIELGSPVDTNGDGINDSTFGAAIAAAEAVRTNPASTNAQLLAQKAILERINVRDGG